MHRLEQQLKPEEVGMGDELPRRHEANAKCLTKVTGEIIGGQPWTLKDGWQTLQGSRVPKSPNTKVG